MSYHFGSLKSLCDAAIEHALERYLDAQQEAVSALGPQPTLEALCAAFGGPMIRGLAAGGGDPAVMRIVARVGADPPQGWDRLSERFDRIRAGPGVDLPHTLRRRIVELAGPRTGRG